MTHATLIERLFGLLPAATLVACAYFTALIVNDYVEAAYIGEPEPPRVANAPRAPVATKPVSKDGTRLAERNMFCSTCETTDHVPATAVAAVTGDAVPETALPLRLVNTNLSTDPESSWATVANSESSRRGAYWVGQNIPGAGPIQTITGRYVDFTNVSTQRVERIRLDKPTVAARTPTTRRSPRSATAQRLEDSVRKVNETTWEVDRSVLSFLSGNPSALRGVRVGPAVKNGKPAGFRISRLSSRSPVAKIGVKRGDIIRAANGTELTSPDVVLKLMTQVKTLNRMVITVERGGKEIELTYLLR